jgi:hypothetical protein
MPLGLLHRSRSGCCLLQLLLLLLLVVVVVGWWVHVCHSSAALGQGAGDCHLSNG